MKNIVSYFIFSCCLLSFNNKINGQANTEDALENAWKNPPQSSKPWVFWYWMQAAVSKQGITADLEAMKNVGIGGAYLMPIKDTSSPSLYQPATRQLSPEWYEMVRFAMEEARRLGLQLGMHVSDGFALAGGPWITPDLSMQKLTWSRTYIKGGQKVEQFLPQPPQNVGYYKDIKVLAYPANSNNAFEEFVLVPSVSSSNGNKPSFLSFENEENLSFKSDSNCWIQYKYPEPFTCRSIKIRPAGNGYQAQRLMVQASDDGKTFHDVIRLDPPRSGWQDADEDVTHSIPETKARYFRFVYDKEGSEPGAEDLDAAKWKPSLKLAGIYLSDEPFIHQFESKNGSVWRVSKNSAAINYTDSFLVRSKDVIDLSDKMDANGKLTWNAPAGNWIVVRVGHTSTGHTNATGGAGKGLECDKFNVQAISLQFDQWFAKVFEKTNPGLAGEVLKIFHVDSWECGSQNWTTSFPAFFRERRGYDMMPYLLAMTGVPINTVNESEKFLHDVRQTIADLVKDVFYATLKIKAKEKGCSFSAESVAPTMVSDGLLHYSQVDLPMGEFWLNSPTHDKPNDMLDAISAANVYGKQVVQAEAFTSVRMNWGEHPGNLKRIGDLNFALGINKMVLHVFTHNPWMNRKPGMTLDGVGLYFQRDQTWFKQGKTWIDYLTRCQVLLQAGKPSRDIAVFTGEEVPRRSLLPDRLVETLPGIFGEKKIGEEKLRLENKGQPLRSIPDGVSHSANMADPEDWVDPLNGYSYDSFNPDALLHLAKVKNGRVYFENGSNYGVLVFPYHHKLQPNRGWMTKAVARKIYELAAGGAAIIINTDYEKGYSLNDVDDSIRWYMEKIKLLAAKKSKIKSIPYHDNTFNSLGVSKDVEFKTNKNKIAWNHRTLNNTDIYFFSNQVDSFQTIDISVRVKDRFPEIWNPVNGEIIGLTGWKNKNGRTTFQLQFEAGQSWFIVFRKKASAKQAEKKSAATKTNTMLIKSPWLLSFDPLMGGPKTPVVYSTLNSWSASVDTNIKYYSGTAIYQAEFDFDKAGKEQKFVLRFDSIYNIATVTLNNTEIGTLWTRPYELDISSLLKSGKNILKVEVSNTWANRLIGDQLLPVSKRITWTTAPFRLAGKPLLPGGILGEVRIITIQQK